MTTDLITRDAEALTRFALTRHGWTEHDIRAAIADATTIGLGWPTICRDLVRLMTIEDAAPADLVTAHQRRNAVADYRTHAAHARQALNHPEDTP